MWDRVHRREHVVHVQHDIIVDERMIRMRVQSEHIDDQHDERQLVIVHHVQHDIMEMETQHRRHQHEHVKRVETEIIVDDEMIYIRVQHDIMEMERQQQEHSQQHVVRVETDITVDDERIDMRVQQER